jgi:hypothetical protein
VDPGRAEAVRGVQDVRVRSDVHDGVGKVVVPEDGRKHEVVGDETEEREELRLLRKENRELRVERDNLEKPSWASPDLLGEKLGLRYEDRGSRERPSAFWTLPGFGWLGSRA